MKTIAKVWFAGVMILIPVALFRAVDFLINYVETEVVTGPNRPLWWRLTSIVCLLAGYVLIPLFAVSHAKNCLKTLSKPKHRIDHYSEAIAELRNEKGA